MKKLFFKITPYIKNMLEVGSVDDSIKKQYCIDKKEYEIKE